MKNFSQFGVEAGMEAGLSIRIVITNYLSITMAFMAPLYGLIFFLLGINLETCSIALIMGVSYASITLMNRCSWTNLSRIWMVLTASMAVLLYSLTFGKETHSHYIFLSLASLPFVLFQFRETDKIALGFFLPVALFLLIEIPPEMTAFKIDLEPDVYSIIRIIAGISALVAQILPVVHLYLSNVQEIQKKEDIYKQYIQTAKIAALGEMAGGVAHEINNPLAVLLLSSERLRRQIKKPIPEPEVLEDTVDRIKSNVERISSIVSGLRDISHDTTHEPAMQINPRDIIISSVNLCKERFKENGIVLTCDLSGETALVWGKGAQLSQALLALLNNAYDAAAGNEAKWVRINLVILPKKVEIRVTDSGRGIHPAIADKVFHPFFTTKPVGKGIGLNLPIARAAVEEHKGELRIALSEEHTTFVVSLPRY